MRKLNENKLKSFLFQNLEQQTFFIASFFWENSSRSQSAQMVEENSFFLQPKVYFSIYVCFYVGDIVVIMKKHKRDGE
jgi:hypothetical protein